MWEVIARWTLLALGLAAGCGDTPAHVTLAPVSLPAGCGRPSGATGIRITAYTPSGDEPRAVGVADRVDLSDFPTDTEQLGVEVAVGGGALGAIGKTAPLAFGDLDDKAAIPIVMIPPDGFCETAGFLNVARRAPLLARAGDGVLVVGGQDAAGNAIGSAEFYDPATATFTPVEVSDVLAAAGFTGTSLATLPSGRVVVTGGSAPAITIFDPVTRTFGESVLIEPRAFHTSIAVSEEEVLLAGGCFGVSAGACMTPRNGSELYSTEKLGKHRLGPTLHVGRYGAQPFDIGVGDDGKHWYVLAGGTAPASVDPSGADLVSPSDTDAKAVTGMKLQVASLDGGALISAFAPDADPPMPASATMLAPGATTAKATAFAPPLAGVRLIGLEDGRVAGFGGDPNGAVQIYDPTIDRWSASSFAGAPLLGMPSLIGLPDGTVLAIDGAGATQTAYLYRPTLTGPGSGSINVSPGTGTTVLTPADPDTIVRAPAWELDATNTDLARALVGGPRNATGSISASVHVLAGGVAVLADQTGPGEVVIGELSPGAKARIVRRSGGVAHVVCTGKAVPELVSAVTAKLAISGTTAHLSLGDDELASCDIGTVARGAWGVAAVGEGARVAVDTVTVAR